MKSLLGEAIRGLGAARLRERVGVMRVTERCNGSTRQRERDLEMEKELEVVTEREGGRDRELQTNNKTEQGIRRTDVLGQALGAHCLVQL